MDEPWTRAIARISVGGVAGFRGTGFLVSDDGLLLTAFHVVGDREASLKKKRAIFYDGPIEIRFGDGKKATWSTGDAQLEQNKYSFEDDWALLRIPSPAAAEPPIEVAPLQLAKLAGQREGREFRSFGFPKREAGNGGEYKGSFGVWSSEGTIEALVDNMDVGMEMGGISGAPCVVDGQVVAMILQSLADEQKAAVKASLYVVPIERAVRGCEGLVAWDAKEPITFQREVERKLPDDASVRKAGEKLGLPEPRRVRDQVARRLLSGNLRAAVEPLQDAGVKESEAKVILQCIAAMQLHDDGVRKLLLAGNQRRPALLSAVKRRIQIWYVRRAYERASEMDIAVVATPAGQEESAAGSRLEAIVDEIVGRLRTALLDQRVGDELIDLMLSSTRDEDGRFWAVLVNESRFDVLHAVGERLPNAQVIGASTRVAVAPEKFETLVDVISPAMTKDEELALIRKWQRSAVDLNVPVEPERDA